MIAAAGSASALAKVVLLDSAANRRSDQLRSKDLDTSHMFR